MSVAGITDLTNIIIPFFNKYLILGKKFFRLSRLV